MRVYVWGIGGGTARILDKWIAVSDVEGFIISDKRDSLFLEYMGRQVYAPEEVSHMAYDVIVVGSYYVENIYEDCKRCHIDLDKVIFLYREGAAADRYAKYDLAERTLGKDVAELVVNSWRVIDSAGIADYDIVDKYSYRNMGGYVTDFVRFRTFELISREIQEGKVQGSVAELGVFRGEFTYFLNREFPDRKCYLFDTFEGFQSEEIRKEIEEGNASAATAESYANTSVDVVKGKLAHMENVEIHKGYFPDSLNGLEDEFAFVSIDVDLEDSIYSGIDYFYPRLVMGGYMMIHDYNSFMHGVKKAVLRYESDNGIKLRKVPLADAAGTLAVVK